VQVQAQLSMLEKQFHRAEAILLDNNEIEEAMEMYQELHKWDESIKIAEKKNHSDVKELKENYYNWLIQTNQDGKAAEVKENEGEFLLAINLYLKGGLPAKAANVVFNYNMSYPQDILEKIAAQLSQSGMYEKAGEFYEQMDMLQRALECYCKGNSYGKAVELAKKSEPKLVVTLEEKWGDWLCSQKQMENAINHYIEANAVQKAIEAALQSRQWNKAVQLISGQPPEISRPFYKQIAKHYAEIRQTDLAEKYFIKSGSPVDAFEMYVKAGKWEQALKVAKDNLSENDIVNLYVKQGQKFQEQGMYKEAERLFLTVEEPDLAITMYKKAGQFDNMIRLVGKYRKNLLKETHLNIAQKLENDGNLKMAENHYIEAGAWRGAVEMYKSHNLWEQVIFNFFYLFNFGVLFIIFFFWFA
jgi:intraflagellar transport protein 172